MAERSLWDDRCPIIFCFKARVSFPSGRGLRTVGEVDRSRKTVHGTSGSALTGAERSVLDDRRSTAERVWEESVGVRVVEGGGVGVAGGCARRRVRFGVGCGCVCVVCVEFGLRVVLGVAVWCGWMLVVCFVGACGSVGDVGVCSCRRCFLGLWSCHSAAASRLSLYRGKSLVTRRPESCECLERRSVAGENVASKCGEWRSSVRGVEVLRMVPGTACSGCRCVRTKTVRDTAGSGTGGSKSTANPDSDARGVLTRLPARNGPSRTKCCAGELAVFGAVFPHHPAAQETGVCPNPCSTDGRHLPTVLSASCCASRPKRPSCWKSPLTASRGAGVRTDLVGAPRHPRPESLPKLVPAPAG
mmetsp:Transcript_9096/g.25397  ORF Transcript_9096/g.25397 Transcript_9096/m.25397 type:complete len:359 (-) Transcript_9096:45-1121(-)